MLRRSADPLDHQRQQIRPGALWGDEARTNQRLDGPDKPPRGVGMQRHQRVAGSQDGAGFGVQLDPCTGLDRILLAGPTCAEAPRGDAHLPVTYISEPTRLGMISYAVFCLKK